MAKYRAKVGLRYPTPGSLKTVLAAGGVSKLSEAQLEKVKFKEVKAGSLCDDIPDKSIKSLLAQGSIEEVTPTAKTTRKGS